jgi:hypothetical protein
VSPVKYELGFYIPEDDILHSHRRESFESYSVLTSASLAYKEMLWQEPITQKLRVIPLNINT